MIIVELPDNFLDSLTKKNDVLEFSLYSWNEINFRIDIIIYSGLFWNINYLFENTTRFSYYLLES